ncbi:uncharacterized protein TM35_000071850 [Trypanosoma theileri]|uniref:Uncharacterized protein n=1 Tax=Trypanosoma theileri TaxID=67003 RepID=A0A1X0P1Q3_9TRYP|nr:uncharacterized protein TM35_000071850 [Trypanosoma theileri]ORC90761.1 hypothetical protein TM35_000071850 [Trypanosoma theileri]
MRSVHSRVSSRSRSRPRPMDGAARSSRPSTAARPPESLARWRVDSNGRLANLDLALLRRDLHRRLADGRLYTLEECRVFLLEMTRMAAAWQAEEIPRLVALADLRDRRLPAAPLAFQWPPPRTDPLPLAPLPTTQPTNAHVVAEMNAAVARMIDRLWESRRQRLLLAARLLQDIESPLQVVPPAGSVSG